VGEHPTGGVEADIHVGLLTMTARHACLLVGGASGRDSEWLSKVGQESASFAGRVNLAGSTWQGANLSGSRSLFFF